MSSWHKLRKYPPHILIRKIAARLRRYAKDYFSRAKDHWLPTYSRPKSTLKLQHYLTPPPLEILHEMQSTLHGITDYFMQHRFDLLGSGWIQVKHGMQCRGVEGYHYQMGTPVIADAKGDWLKARINRANRAQARRIWRQISDHYTPIDWHIDFKSGYRWPEATWFQDIQYGNVPGADVKVPWELARMQHLPAFVWQYQLTQNPELVREFQNQILDFIAANPPRYGVNWKTTMDVAIRVANWLVSYDLLHTAGASFSTAFTRIFTQSVYEHGRHIFNNLEYSPTLRGNHYLANIAGLLFVAGYLDGVPDTKRWWEFACRELVAEVKSQFYEDGSNFEASTSYHRLSAEMVVYATALIRAVDSQRLISYAQRLAGMAAFTRHITKPNGEIPQIGDNDNGRFFKFQPQYQHATAAEMRARYLNLSDYCELPDDASYFDELFLNHTHLTHAIDALFGKSPRGIDGYLVYALCQGNTLPIHTSVALEAVGDNIGEWQDQIKVLPGQVTDIPIADSSIYDDLHLFAYPDFGLYIFRSPRFYLAVRCGPIGQNGQGGHAHLDQLHVELQIDGQDISKDPGTYLYTPLPHHRNQYRSAHAHYVPLIKDIEPGELNKGLFTLHEDWMQARCLYFGKAGFVGVHYGYAQPVYRMIYLEPQHIHIEDHSEQGWLLSPRLPALPYSPKYGSITHQKL